MTRQQRHDLVRLKPRIAEPLNDSIHRIRRLRNSKVNSRLRGRRTTEEKIELGSAGTVSRADRCGEVDEVAGGEVRGLKDGELLGGDVVDAVRMVFESLYVFLLRRGLKGVKYSPDVGVWKVCESVESGG